MNGAIALPCVSTISAPNSAMTSRIGSNQNFFRVMTKAASSLAKLSMTLELPRHRLGRRAWRPPLDPVTLCGRVELQRQGMPPEHSHHESDGCDARVEHQPQDVRVDRSVEQKAQPQPQSVDRAERRWTDHGEHEKDARDQEPPPAGRIRTPHPHPADDGARAGEEESKTAIRRAGDGLAAVQVFVER